MPDHPPRAAQGEPASCGPAASLDSQTLLTVAIESAGRLAMHESQAQFDRLVECRAELSRRLAAPAGEPAPSVEAALSKVILTAAKNGGALLRVLQGADDETVRLKALASKQECDAACEDLLAAIAQAEASAAARWKRAALATDLVSAGEDLEPEVWAERQGAAIGDLILESLEAEIAVARARREALEQARKAATQVAIDGSRHGRMTWGFSETEWGDGFMDGADAAASAIRALAAAHTGGGDVSDIEWDFTLRDKQRRWLKDKYGIELPEDPGEVFLLSLEFYLKACQRIRRVARPYVSD